MAVTAGPFRLLIIVEGQQTLVAGVIGQLWSCLARGPEQDQQYCAADHNKNYIGPACIFHGLHLQNIALLFFVTIAGRGILKREFAFFAGEELAGQQPRKKHNGACYKPGDHRPGLEALIQGLNFRDFSAQ